MRKSSVLSFDVIEDYFKGAGNGTLGANQLTHRAPAAIFNTDRLNRLSHYLQSAARTNTNAETAAGALRFIYRRLGFHFLHSSLKFIPKKIPRQRRFSHQPGCLS